MKAAVGAQKPMSPPRLNGRQAEAGVAGVTLTSVRGKEAAAPHENAASKNPKPHLDAARPSAMTTAGFKGPARNVGAGTVVQGPAEAKSVGRRVDADSGAAPDGNVRRGTDPHHPSAAGGPASAGSPGSTRGSAEEAHPGLPVPIASFTI